MDISLKYASGLEEKILIRKIQDMINRSEKTYTILYTHFLTPAEQQLLQKVDEFKGKVSFDGGYDEAERRMGRICTNEYQTDDGIPCRLLSSVPTASSAEISHRDVLGSLMGLGIKREMIGDIIVDSGKALFFCDMSVADYVEMNLEKVGRYKVKVSAADLDEVPKPRTELRSININSPRIDSICAECFGMSRTKAAEAIRHGIVTVDWQICDNVSRELKGGVKIAVRGKGKVKYNGITGTSKKGRMFAEIEKYI